MGLLRINLRDNIPFSRNMTNQFMITPTQSSVVSNFFTFDAQAGRNFDVCWASESAAQPASVVGAMKFSLLCGLPVLPAAIPGRFSSSSLPPSFVRGRRTTVFAARGTAGGGAPFSSAEAAR